MRIEIGKRMDNGKPFFLDVEKIIEGRLGIWASSGGGKSAAARLLAEKINEKYPVIILDKNGEFYTLREKHNFVLAGPSGDIPADPRTAGKLAIKVMELGSSLIVDLSGLKPDEKHEYVKNFVRGLMDAPKGLWSPRLFITDEAHKFCPENGEGFSVAKMHLIEACEDGRKRELGTTLLTQRVVKMDKSAMAELRNKMIGLTNTPDDRARAAKELGFQGKEDIYSLGKLDPGQFYCLGPAFGKEIVLVQLEMPKTRHEFKRGGGRTPAPTQKVKEALLKLKEIPQEAKEEARTMADLQIQNAKLKKELEQAGKVAAKVVQPIQVQPLKMAHKEIERTRNEAALSIYAGVLRDIIPAFKKFRLKLEQALMETEAFDLIVRRIEKGMKAKTQSRPAETIKEVAEKTLGLVKTSRDVEAFARTDVAKAIGQEFHEGSEGSFNQTKRAILKFLSSRPDRAFTPKQVAAMTFKRLTGTFNTYLSELSRDGLIERGGGQIKLKDLEKAIRILGPEYSTPEKDLDEWLSKFNPTQKKIYEVLREDVSKEWTVPELAEACGVNVTGTFNTYLSELSTLELIRRGGGKVRFNKEILSL